MTGVSNVFIVLVLLYTAALAQLALAMFYSILIHVGTVGNAPQYEKAAYSVNIECPEEFSH